MEQIVFVIQKIILRLLFPVSIALFLGIMALILRRRRELSLWLLCACVVWLLVASFPITGLLLVRSIESKAGDYADPEDLSRKGVKYVVVLSGGFRQGPLTSGDRLGCSVPRLLEGMRLWRQIPDCKLVLTGGRIPGLSTEMTIAQALADTANEMGVPRDVMVLEDLSWTTEDQARLCSGIVGEQAFALVTSAYHMPRSMIIFEQAGLHPISAPADFIAKVIPINYETLIPQAGGLITTQIAFKEYMATWWALLKDRLHYSGCQK